MPSSASQDAEAGKKLINFERPFKKMLIQIFPIEVSQAVLKRDLNLNVKVDHNC